MLGLTKKHILVLSLGLLTSCGSYGKAKPGAFVPPKPPAPTDGRPLAQARVLNGVLQQSLQWTEPFEATVVKARLAQAQMLLKEQEIAHEATETAQGASDQRQADAYATAVKEAKDAKAAYDKLADEHNRLLSEWYVVAGLWLERAAWTVALVWLVLNIVSFLGGCGSPGSWIALLAKQIRLFMPGMNLSSWALAWKAKAAAKSEG
jgi:hypothetical protein